MARNAQMLIDLATEIISASEGSGEGLGLRNQIYNSSCPKPMLPMLTSMVNGAATNREQLLAVAEEDGLFDNLTDGCLPIDDHIQELSVVLYECLLGSRRVRGHSPIVELVKSRKKTLQQTLAGRRKRGATNKYSPKKQMPRFVRVNTLLATVEEAVEYLKSFGMTQTPTVRPSSESNMIPPVPPKTFAIDPHLPTLFHLPSNLYLHDDEFVSAGKFILQDRSSCLVAEALNPPPGSICVDTCSSPGNKTLHLAAIIGNEGRIKAFERSTARLATLNRRVTEMGASHIITTFGEDFTDVDPSSETFRDVSHVLIDPSCSGSGLVASQSADVHAKTEEDAAADHDAVSDLAAGQKSIVLHAMDIPSARAISYSTCSVFEEENEAVVHDVLAERSDWVCVPVIASWPHRGIPGDGDKYRSFCSNVIRATYVKDTTNGFFVARFEKKVTKEATKHKKKKREGETKEERRERKEKKRVKRELAEKLGTKKKRGEETELERAERKRLKRKKT